MKPLNIDKTGCTNVSSNCVTWQGPDIPCISLCKGDSVTDVVYKLATELCTLMDTFDLANYDLQCFSTGVCQPQTFKDFINILINKVCLIQTCSGCGDACNPCPTPPVTLMSASMPGAATASYVSVARDFQYTNPAGDTVTTMTVTDYATAIGNKISTTISDVAILQKTISEQSSRLATIENMGTPVVELPTITPVSVLPNTPHSMDVVLAATEKQLSELKSAVGTHTDIHTNIQKQSANINEAKSLANSGVAMSNLTGWNSTVKNQADAIGNLFLMVNDMRAAMQNIMTNYIPNECDSIKLELNAVYRNEAIMLYVNGTLPGTFANNNINGTLFTIKDSFGASMSTSINLFDLINRADGYAISLNNTRLVANSTLTITAEPSFVNKSTGSMCKSFLQTIISNTATCPTVGYTPSASAINFTFSSTSTSQIYTVELYDATGVTLVSSVSYPSTMVQSITGSFTGLTTKTLYKARVKMLVNGTETLCEYTTVTTL